MIYKCLTLDTQNTQCDCVVGWIGLELIDAHSQSRPLEQTWISLQNDKETTDWFGFFNEFLKELVKQRMILLNVS